MTIRRKSRDSSRELERLAIVQSDARIVVTSKGERKCHRCEQSASTSELRTMSMHACECSRRQTSSLLSAFASSTQSSATAASCRSGRRLHRYPSLVEVLVALSNRAAMVRHRSSSRDAAAALTSDANTDPAPVVSPHERTMLALQNVRSERQSADLQQSVQQAIDPSQYVATCHLEHSGEYHGPFRD